MGCSTCGGAAARAVEKWTYTHPNGQQTVVGSKAQADMLVTVNGGGSVRQEK